MSKSSNDRTGKTVKTLCLSFSFIAKKLIDQIFTSVMTKCARSDFDLKHSFILTLIMKFQLLYEPSQFVG